MSANKIKMTAYHKRRECGRLDLDERKRKILQAIIRNYLETGEPVGSRTISKYTDLNLSSATIRNEIWDISYSRTLRRGVFPPIRATASMWTR